MHLFTVLHPLVDKCMDGCACSAVGPWKRSQCCQAMQHRNGLHLAHLYWASIEEIMEIRRTVEPYHICVYVSACLLMVWFVWVAERVFCLLFRSQASPETCMRGAHNNFFSFSESAQCRCIAVNCRIHLMMWLCRGSIIGAVLAMNLRYYTEHR